jgi:hypothetical protein
MMTHVAIPAELRGQGHFVQLSTWKYTPKAAKAQPQYSSIIVSFASAASRVVSAGTAVGH